MSKKSHKSSLKKAAPKTTSKNIYWILGGLALIVVIAAAGLLLLQNNDSSSNAALSKEISVQEAYAMRQDGAFILDVRQPEEWIDYHIPGSTLIPLGELESRLSEVPKDKDVVVVCRSGNRSQEGRDILSRAGFSQVTSMAGGVSTWRANGYETVTGP